MPRSRPTTATQRPKAQATALPDEVVAFLTEGGWVHGDSEQQPTSTSLWAHATKAGGNPLPAEQAYEFETRAREATAAQGDVESDEARAIRLESEAAYEAQAAREREAAAEATATAKAAADRAEQEADLRRRIDLAERAAAEAAASPEPEFVHDGIGAVSIWRCYRCNFSCRHAVTCPCPTCVAITAAVECPNCGDKQPNMDPGRR